MVHDNESLKIRIICLKEELSGSRGEQPSSADNAVTEGDARQRSHEERQRLVADHYTAQGQVNLHAQTLKRIIRDIKTLRTNITEQREAEQRQGLTNTEKEELICDETSLEAKLDKLAAAWTGLDEVIARLDELARQIQSMNDKPENKGFLSPPCPVSRRTGSRLGSSESAPGLSIGRSSEISESSDRFSALAKSASHPGRLPPADDSLQKVDTTRSI
jgi:hypothetical protein